MSSEHTVTYSVPEISCDHCKTTIETAVAELDAVVAVSVDVPARTVTVEGGDADTVVDAIEAVGFDVVRS